MVSLIGGKLVQLSKYLTISFSVIFSIFPPATWYHTSYNEETLSKLNLKLSTHDCSTVTGAEMPTSGDLKSRGTPVSIYPTPSPQEKGDETSSPSNCPPCPLIEWEKWKKISEVFERLPKLTKVF